MEIVHQGIVKQATREILFSAILSAIEDKLVSLYDPELHNFSAGLSTGLPHSKRILDMANEFLKDTGNGTPWGFAEWWSKNSKYSEIFEIMEPDFLDIAKKLKLNFDKISASEFFLDDVDDLQFEAEDFRDSFLKKPEGKSFVLSVVGDVVESFEKEVAKGRDDAVPFDVLQVLLEMSDREDFVKALYDGFTMVALDYPAVVFLGDKKAVAFV